MYHTALKIIFHDFTVASMCHSRNSGHSCSILKRTQKVSVVYAFNFCGKLNSKTQDHKMV